MQDNYPLRIVEVFFSVLLAIIVLLYVFGIFMILLSGSETRLTEGEVYDKSFTAAHSQTLMLPMVHSNGEESLKAKESDARAILYKYMRMLAILSITSILWFGVWRWSWVNPFSNESHVVACAIFWSCTAVWGNALGNVLREIAKLYRGICWICVALKEEQEQEPS